jgi:hypothetical protein
MLAKMHRCKPGPNAVTSTYCAAGEDRGVTGNVISKRIEDASFDAQLHI